MDTIAGFIFKILVLSASIAVVIKFVAPKLAIPATSTVALVAVLLPSFVMASILSWRAWQQQRQQH